MNKSFVSKLITYSELSSYLIIPRSSKLNIKLYTSNSTLALVDLPESINQLINITFNKTRSKARSNSNPV